MSTDVSIEIKDSITISPDYQMLRNATDEDRENAMCDLFSSLTSAIRDKNCSVNMDDPDNIIVTRK